MVRTSKALALVQGVHALDNVSTEQVGEVMPQPQIAAAFKEQKKLQKDKSMMVTLFLSIGASLKKIRDNRWYLALGSDSFDGWVENPEIDIDRSSAYRYVKLFEVYVDSGAFELDEINGQSISKLEVLIPMVDPKAADWEDRKSEVMALLQLSRKDLITTLNEHGDTRYTPPAPSNRNAAGSMAVGANYEVSEESSPHTQKPETSKKSKEADSTFAEVVESGKPRASSETVPVPEAMKKIGLSGWYELVPTAEPPSGKGKVSKGIYITTESLIVTGNRIFINIE